jgi:hypothetical protein
MQSSRRYNMTVGTTPARFVWFRVAKAGTRSTLAVLREHIGDFEIEEGFSKKFRPAKYEDHFKFTFVRNPFARILSGWRDKIVQGAPGGGALSAEDKVYLSDFDRFVEWLIAQDPETVNIHFRPQHLLVPDKVDFVGRLETFDADLRQVLQRLGVDKVGTIPHRNRSESRTTKGNEVSPNARCLIVRHFRADYERFGYPTENK